MDTAAGSTNRAEYPASWRGEPTGSLICPALAWARLTGRVIDLRDEPWLRGPSGEVDRVGEEYFASLARETGWEVRVNAPGAGLTPCFDDLRSETFDSTQAHPQIRDFYEHTGDYRLDLWSYWCRYSQPSGWLINALFSRRLQQLNLPISPMDPSRGIISDIVQLLDRQAGAVQATGWLRRFNLSGEVIYVGFYSIAQPRHAPGPCVKVVFPLPNGSASVFLKPVLHEDGSLELLSSGRRFGDPGFYFTVRRSEDTVWAKYVPAMKESIHVYVDNRDDLRADHVFRLWGMPFLKLHYVMPRHTRQWAERPGAEPQGR
jgi:hypothetical protein